jgi:hypothetical protein
MSEEDLKHGKYLMRVVSPELPIKQQQRQIALYTESPMIEIVTINRNMGAPAEQDATYLGVVVALQHSMARGSSVSQLNRRKSYSTDSIFAHSISTRLIRSTSLPSTLGVSWFGSLSSS